MRTSSKPKSQTKTSTPPHTAVSRSKVGKPRAPIIPPSMPTPGK